MKRKAKVTTKSDLVHWDALAVYDIFDSEITDYEDELPLLPPSDSDEERPKVVEKENANQWKPLGGPLKDYISVLFAPRPTVRSQNFVVMSAKNMIVLIWKVTKIQKKKRKRKWRPIEIMAI